MTRDQDKERFKTAPRRLKSKQPSKRDQEIEERVRSILNKD